MLDFRISDYGSCSCRNRAALREEAGSKPSRREIILFTATTAVNNGFGMLTMHAGRKTAGHCHILAMKSVEKRLQKWALLTTK
ncbi:hypothetical protein HF329_27395 [Chitinophaga oryzae]|uniref:Uncharacterized protein n=1 Tax=Chitinophaga oryzae TaxID=2725414 RepID=A0AAE6ZN60_9BACT|nr:hypothetical protein [Chitinophaga oryzae]QJB34825.1 hypothetical protein HF329_27395 [Chitinophaga oryzae]